MFNDRARGDGPTDGQPCRLMVISGLPGVGKTSVAASLAARTGAVHLSIDAVEESILACGLPHSWEVGVAAYEAVRAMAEMNLALGRDVVVDAVNDSADARQTWHRAANASCAMLTFVHLVCSDPSQHRQRLSGRDRGFIHVAEPEWQHVQARARSFAPWTEKVLVLDTANRSVEAIVDSVQR